MRDTDAAPITELRKRPSGRTETLEKLAIEMYARGCSTRDIEAIFADKQGPSLLSRTARGGVTEALWEEYKGFDTRDLKRRQADVFVPGWCCGEAAARGEAGRRCWRRGGSPGEGRKVPVHLAQGSKEWAECAVEVLQDCRRRGLSTPVRVVSDGAAGLIRAVETCSLSSLRQRCLVHTMRYIAATRPESA